MREKVVAFPRTELNLVDVGIVLFAIALAAVGYAARPDRERAAARRLRRRRRARRPGRPGAARPTAPSRSYAPLVAVVDRGPASARSSPSRSTGSAARLRRPRTGAAVAASLDGIGGALLLGALALLLAWGFGAVALHASGDRPRDLREAVQRSAILGALNDALPPSGPLLHVLRRVDPTPAVRGPDADVAAPDRGIVDDPDVRAAGDSTVRVLGTACGLGVEGSGWVAGAGPRGHQRARGRRRGRHHGHPRGRRRARRDRGPLRPPQRPRPARASTGSTRRRSRSPSSRARATDGAVIGYPENGPLTFTPARLGRTGTVTSQDSYGRGPVQRRMTPFRADVRSGNSGGPVVDLDGRCRRRPCSRRRPARGQPNGLGVPNSVVARRARR